MNGSEGKLGVSGFESYVGHRFDGALGFIRGYVASIGKSPASDIRYMFASPQFRRLFSSETPKKKSKFSLLLMVW